MEATQTTTKKFVNDPARFVPEMIEGLLLANPDTLAAEMDHQIVYRKGMPSDDKVSVIQGSGSGHEPAHYMVVGRGMLDAAVQGNVFAAPPVDAVARCFELMKSEKGILHIVNNYQGDRMAWEMAAEMAEADGVETRRVLVNDDVAVEDSLYTVGRRGVAGNFFVIKTVGAASEEGADLDELVRIGEKTNAAVRTMGVALTSCRPPAKDTTIFEIGDDEMEVGVGIHGEPGRRRETVTNADAIVEELLEAVASDLPFEKGDRVGLMINGLGGTPISELYLLYRKAHQLCGDRGFTVSRNYVGEYCTSLEMAGMSVTLIRLDDEIDRLLAAPAEVPLRTF